MFTSLSSTKKGKIAFAIFLIYTLWWVALQLINLPEQSPILDHFAASYCLIAILGGVWGLKIAKKWGSYTSIMGRSILMLSLGLLAQAFGQLVYTVYVMILNIEIPYPSLGDVGYFGSVLFYIYGVYLLAKASGVKFSLKSFENKIQAIVIPLLILGLSYYIFLIEYQFDWTLPLTILLDFGYPLGQSFYISIAILLYLLTRNLLGGLMRNKILFLLVALFAQYAADFNFLFQNSRGTWTYAGYGDYLYFFSYFIMTLALLKLRNIFSQNKRD